MDEAREMVLNNIKYNIELLEILGYKIYDNTGLELTGIHYRPAYKEIRAEFKEGEKNVQG